MDNQSILDFNKFIYENNDIKRITNNKLVRSSLPKRDKAKHPAGTS